MNPETARSVMPGSPSALQIAGLNIPLTNASAVLADLAALYDEFAVRTDAFKSNPANPHLCRAGCSHCCRSGAVFALTLAEALHWSLALDALPPTRRDAIRSAATALHDLQLRAFDDGASPADTPGAREETRFSARVSRLARAGHTCPVLDADLCSTYAGRPMLCRAYGFPVDAWAVHSESTIVFRSLCQLYDGHSLTDYVRARDLRDRLAALSSHLGGRNWGRFTSIEAILSHVDQRRADPGPVRPA